MTADCTTPKSLLNEYSCFFGCLPDPLYPTHYFQKYCFKKSNHLIPLQKTAKMHFRSLRGKVTLPPDIPMFSRPGFISSSAFPSMASPYSSGCHRAAMPNDPLVLQHAKSSHLPSTPGSLLGLDCPSFLQSWKNPLPSSKPSSLILPGSFLRQLHD